MTRRNWLFTGTSITAIAAFTQFWGSAAMACGIGGNGSGGGPGRAGAPLGNPSRGPASEIEANMGAGRAFVGLVIVTIGGVALSSPAATGAFVGAGALAGGAIAVIIIAVGIAILVPNAVASAIDAIKDRMATASSPDWGR